LLALLAAAVWWYPSLRDQLLAKNQPKEAGFGAGAAARATPVSVGEVRQSDLRVSVTALGSINAVNTAVVRAKVDGELIVINKVEGQSVQAGAVLAEIDARPFKIQLDQAQGQLQRDQAQLTNAKLDLQRYQELMLKDAIPRQQLETQQALVRQLEGTVFADQAQVDNARLQLSYTKVTAPISGRIGLKQIELGSLARSSDASGLFTITQTHPMAVVFSVPDLYVAAIQRKLKNHESLPVQVLDRDLKPMTQGEVNTTDNAIDPATGTLKIKALVDNLDGQLFPNQFAQVRLQLDTLKQRMVVPGNSIQRGSIGTFLLKVGSDKTVKVVKVQIEGADGAWQAVQAEANGLSVGDQVVTDGADRLRDGSRIEVVSVSNPAQSTGPSAKPQKTAPAAAETSKPTDANNRPAWMDRLPPEIAAKVQAMNPEERRAFFQRMRERRANQGQ
jgi:multidrug efflux system membrane fusion protein